MLIKIYRKDLTIKPKYLNDGLKYDILGQLLFQLGHDIPTKAKLPSELNKYIEHFTISIRGKIIDSPMSIELVTASSTVHPDYLCTTFNNIFTKYRTKFRVTYE